MDSMKQTRSHSQHHGPPCFRLGDLKNCDLYEITIEQLQSYLADGLITSVDYVKFCVERIRMVNPYLEAVIEINPDAVEIAKSLDDERKRGAVRSMLHGIPILVKDNMNTEDKMQTTAGSWALLGSKTPKDAHIVSLLRKSGAIILGHSNMSELSSVRSTGYSTGYSPRGGQVRNPYDLSYSPFGSSSGSAVAVSANIVPLAFGTETDTSIIGPASINGIIGIKPTVGLTSRTGVIPISKNLDTVGCFGRTVADAAHGLTAIAGKDDEDDRTLSQPFDCEEDYSKHITSQSALKGAKFGLPWKRCWDSVAPDLKAVAERILKAIKEAGAQVIRTDFPCVEDRISPDGSWDWNRGDPSHSEFTVVKVDAYNGINDYLAQLSDTSMKTVEDIVDYNDRNTGTEGAEPGDIPAFPSGQENLRLVAESRGVEDETYQQALKHIQSQCRENGIDAALTATTEEGQTVELDALLLCDRKGAGQQIAAQAGYPIICIPIGLDSAGFPISLSIQHTAWSEGTLIKWASAIEDLVHHIQGPRPTPGYRNHTSKNIPIKKIGPEGFEISETS